MVLSFKSFVVLSFMQVFLYQINVKAAEPIGLKYFQFQIEDKSTGNIMAAKHIKIRKEEHKKRKNAFNYFLFKC